MRLAFFEHLATVVVSVIMVEVPWLWIADLAAMLDNTCSSPLCPALKQAMVCCVSGSRERAASTPPLEISGLKLPDYWSFMRF
jgi:hypothetical protein